MVRAIQPSAFELAVVWISGWSGTGATGQGGLSRLDMATGAMIYFQHDPRDPGSLSRGRVASLYEGRDGTLWAGGWGLNRFDRATGTFKRFFPDPAYPDYDPAATPENLVNRIFSIHEDRAGVLWVGTITGLHRFNSQNGTFTHGTWLIPQPRNHHAGARGHAFRRE